MLKIFKLLLFSVPCGPIEVDVNFADAKLSLGTFLLFLDAKRIKLIFLTLLEFKSVSIKLDL